MTEEQIALAKRAVECKAWKWMPGMLACDARFIRHRIQDDGSALDLSDDILNRAWGYSPDTLRPILTDPATLGCLLALVREHHKEPRLAVVPNGKGWSVSRVWLRSPHDRVAGVHTLEAEALVAALEAAP